MYQSKNNESKSLTMRPLHLVLAAVSAADAALLPRDNYSAEKVPTVLIPPTVQQQERKDICDAPNWALRNVTRSEYTHP